MKYKIHSLIVEGILFCGSGLGLLSYSLISYGRAFNKSWAQSPYLFPLLVGAALTGLSVWIMGEGVQAMKRENRKAAGGGPSQTTGEGTANGQAIGIRTATSQTAGGGSATGQTIGIGTATSQTTESGSATGQTPGKTGSRGQIRGVVMALVLCGIYYLALAGLKLPYITIGIFSFLYTFSTFEVVTLVFLAAMMAFMGVRKIPVLVLVPVGTTLFLSIAFRTLLHVLLP